MLTLPTIVNRIASELKYGCIYSREELRTRRFFTLWSDADLVEVWKIVEPCNEMEWVDSKIREVIRDAIQIEMDSRLPK